MDEKEKRQTEVEVLIADQEWENLLEEIQASAWGLTIEQFRTMVTLPEDEREAYLKEHQTE